MLVAIWVQHNTLRGNFGLGRIDVVFPVPDGPLSEQRKLTADFCSNVGVDRIADALDSDATPVAVSSAYAESVEPSDSPRHRVIRAGCLAGLAR